MAHLPASSFQMAAFMIYIEVLVRTNRNNASRGYVIVRDVIVPLKGALAATLPLSLFKSRCRSASGLIGPEGNTNS